MNPAPLDRCRVLEVGCGDGGNLVPMAYSLPTSTFVGIDLASQAIRTARDFARRAGVLNVAFEPLDLALFPEESGAFDFIIAHGIYSWVPAEVRDRLLALIGRHLAPQGIAFVSYNTFPGCHLRQMMWEILKFHTAELEKPQTQLSEAQALVRLIAHGNASVDEYTQPLVAEARRMEDRPPALLYHDDLSKVNEPVYFHEFAAHAACHGLQYLAEAAFVMGSYVGIASSARAVLAALDPITRQQYLDFIKCRRFRESLLCRNEVALDRSELPERMRTLTFTAARKVRRMQQNGIALKPASEPADTPVADAGGARMQSLLDTLRAAAPEALPFDALVDRLRVGSASEPGAENQSFDAQTIVLASLQAGVIEPHVSTPKLAFASGERPTASAIVRAQLDDGDVVTSLWHWPVKIDDDLTKRLLPLLDGTRDRKELLGLLTGEPSAKPSFDATMLDEQLHRLATLGLLVT